MIKSNDTQKLWKTAPLTFLGAALLPEYVAPVLAVVCFSLVLKNRINSGKKPYFGSLGVSVLFFMAWMVIASVYSSGIVTSLASIGLWILMLSGFYFVNEVIDTEGKIEKMFLAGSLSAGTAGAIGIIQMVLYHCEPYRAKGLHIKFNPFWHFIDIDIANLAQKLPEFFVSKLPKTKFSLFPQRGCSTFTNPLFFSAFEVMMIPLSAYCFLCSKNKKHRIIGLICFMLSIGGVASSYSRGPYIAAAAVIILLLLYGGKKAVLIGSISAAAGAVLTVFSSGTIKRILTLVTNKNDISINTRTKIWAAALDMVKKHPVFGYGTGFNNVRQELHNVYNIQQPHAHNIILEIWLENGIFGVLLFAAILVVFAVNIIRVARKSTQGRYYAVTLFASAAGFLACGMTDCLFYGLKPLQYLMLIFGLSQAAFSILLKDEEFFLLPKKLKEKLSFLLNIR